MNPFDDEMRARLEAGAAEAEAPASGPSARIAVRVDGGDPKKRLAGLVIADGRLTEVTDGPPDDADFELVMKQKDALAVLGGDLRPSAAFMQGRFKLDGDPGGVLDLLEWFDGPVFAAALAALSAD